MNEAPPSDDQIIESLELALRSLWNQHDALQRLAAHYPEARHILSSPRKPDAIVILERLLHAIQQRVNPLT